MIQRVSSPIRQPPSSACSAAWAPHSTSAAIRTCGYADSSEPRVLLGRPKTCSFAAASAASQQVLFTATSRSPRWNAPGGASSASGPAVATNRSRSGSDPSRSRDRNVVGGVLFDLRGVLDSTEACIDVGLSHGHVDGFDENGIVQGTSLGSLLKIALQIDLHGLALPCDLTPLVEWRRLASFNYDTLEPHVQKRSMWPWLPPIATDRGLTVFPHVVYPPTVSRCADAPARATGITPSSAALRSGMTLPGAHSWSPNDRTATNAQRLSMITAIQSIRTTGLATLTSAPTFPPAIRAYAN